MPTAEPTSVPAASSAPTITPAPATGAQPHPSLTIGSLGRPDDLTPTNEEIASARATLGSGLIGVVACTLGTEYHSIVAADAQARAEALGFRVEVFDSQAQAERQPDAIKELVARGAKIIAICILDPKVASEAIKAAEDAGTYIVQFGGSALDVNGVTIGGGEGSDIDLGCAAGEVAGDLIAQEKDGKATVAILDYPSLPQIVLRADSIEKCLKTRASGAAVVGRWLGGTTDNALTSMRTALQAHPDIDVVVSINDAGAYGALSALENAGKDPKRTIVVGIDGESHARELIKRGGFYRGSVDTSPGLTGRLLIDAAVKLLASATIPQNIRVPVTKITAETLK
ncbi:MAG TPA: sugar ABC transporter substrate-binding protein [Roseiflexaceae bacterium]|nr:sugar ABC transporter substrate-binding protein [Roseiflexaceae bacterium]